MHTLHECALIYLVTLGILITNCHISVKIVVHSHTGLIFNNFFLEYDCFLTDLTQIAEIRLLDCLNVKWFKRVWLGLSELTSFSLL